MYDLIEKLQNWYGGNQAMINHDNGIIFKLYTIDNPGWRIKINLSNTTLEKYKFTTIRVERSEYDWIFCKVKDKVFDVACGSLNLKEALQIFFNWHDSIALERNKIKKADDISYFIEKLQDWYTSNCDGDWEHGFGLRIETLDKSGWLIKINLLDTVLEDIKFEPVKIKRNASNWIFCEVKEFVFEITCGSLNLKEGLKIFLDWYESIAVENDDT